MHNRLTLVGYRACGKSTVGRLAAARLGWPYADADAVIELALGLPIRRYWAEHGEAAFREAEAAALERLLADEAALVLATGGGAVLREANRGLISARGGLVAYLHVPAEVLQDRLRRSHGGRPSLSGGSLVDEVPAQLAAREGLYRAIASATVDATRPLAEVADALCALALNQPSP